MQNYRLYVNNADQIPKNRRRVYLVRTTYGLLWVLLCRETRGRIRIGVFMVERPLMETLESPPDRSSTNMTYRITWSDFEGRARATQSKTRGVAWSSTLKDGKGFGISASGNVDPFTVIRSRSGRLEISWYNITSIRRNQKKQKRSTSPAISTVTSTQNSPIEAITHQVDE